MPLHLARFQRHERIVDAEGRFTPLALTRFQQRDKQIEDAINGLEETVDAVIAAQAAADAANAAAAAADAAAANAQTAADTAQGAADDITAASYLADSYIANFTPPVVQADAAGNVTIANHDRIYGDGSTVAITGDVVATGEVNPAYVYINYSDPTRADTTPTFTFSTDEASAAQIGDNHHVGAVQIPAAGTADGGYPRPPGYGGVIP